MAKSRAPEVPAISHFGVLREMIRKLPIFTLLVFFPACGITHSQRPAKIVSFSSAALGAGDVTAIYEYAERKEKIKIVRNENSYNLTLPSLGWTGLSILPFIHPPEPSDKE